MNYIKVSQAAEKWGLFARRVRILCQENKIEGVIRKGNLYMIPENAQKPADGRVMEKAGMHKDAVLRDRRINKHTGERNDTIIYSITKKGIVMRFDEMRLIEFVTPYYADEDFINKI